MITAALVAEHGRRAAACVVLAALAGCATLGGGGRALRDARGIWTATEDKPGLGGLSTYSIDPDADSDEVRVILTAWCSFATGTRTGRTIVFDSAAWNTHVEITVLNGTTATAILRLKADGSTHHMRLKKIRAKPDLGCE